MISRFDPVRPEQFEHLVQASPRQPDVVRMKFGAGDDARLAEGGQPHRLGAVELRVLERGEAHEPRHQRRRELGAVDVDPVREHGLDAVRERPGDRFRVAASRRRQQPRLVGVLVLDRHPHAEHAGTAGLGLGDEGRDRGPIQAPNRRQEGPLVVERAEIVVDEQAVALLAGAPLQRQGDQVAEAAGRHGVLAGEEPVVGGEADLRPALHRLGDQHGAKLPRLARGDAARRRRSRRARPRPSGTARARPERPGRGTSRGRRARRAPSSRRRSRRRESGRSRPAAGDKPRPRSPGTRCSWPHVILAAQMALDHLVRHWDEGLVRALATLHARLAADPRHPLVGTGRRVARPLGLGVLPAHREHVRPAREQSSEERHLRRRWRRRGDATRNCEV